jgi:hypothetical protein
VYVCGKIAHQPQQHTTQVCLANKKMSNSTFTGKFPPHYFKGCHQVYIPLISELRKPLFSLVCQSAAAKLSKLVFVCHCVPVDMGLERAKAVAFSWPKKTPARLALSHYILCVPITAKTRQKGIDRVSAWRSRFAFQRLLGNGVFINRERL